MIQKEERDKQIWWILQEIKKEQLLTKNGGKIKFVLRVGTDNNTPDTDTQLKLLNYLATDSDNTTEYSNCIEMKVEKSFYLIRIIPYKFNIIYEIYESQNTKEDHNKKTSKKSDGVKSSCWIRKEEDKYFYKEKPLQISQRANYFIIFDVVYHLAETGGDIKYDKIKECCKKRKLKTTRRQIQRALCGESSSLFQHTDGIDRLLPNRISLFEADPDGKFLKFNNKKN